MRTLIIAALVFFFSIAALAQGPGRVPEEGRGRAKESVDNTPGWSLMTPAERSAYREKMASFKSYDECSAYHREHLGKMEARAQETRKAFTAPPANACDRMKERGLIK